MERRKTSRHRRPSRWDFKERETDVKSGLGRNGKALKQCQSRLAVVKVSAYFSIAGMSSGGKGGLEEVPWCLYYSVWGSWLVVEGGNSQGLAG